MTAFEKKNPAHRYSPTWNKIAIDEMKIWIFIQRLTWEPQGARTQHFSTDTSGLKKNLNTGLSFGQAALTFCLPGATSYPSQFMIFVRGRLARTLSKLETLLAQQEDLLVPDYSILDGTFGALHLSSCPSWRGTHK